MNINILNFCSYELKPKVTNKRFLSLVYESLITEGNLSRLKNHSEFPKNLLEDLLNNYSFENIKTEKILNSKDKTYKFLFRLTDGSLIESVAIPFNAKYTICLSSQVGCAMKCSFCYTGDYGFKRNLEPYEILGQYLSVWSFLKKHYGHKKTPNIVFMGQGEPLKNLKNVAKAIDIFLDLPGLKLGPKQITLSTVGVYDELQNMFELPPVNIAVSLHSANNNARDQLIPSNKKLGIEKLFEWIDSKEWNKKRKINFEYLLLKGINSSKEDAQELAQLLKDRVCLVNLIPFNPYPGARYQKPDEHEVEAFKDVLVKHHVRVMVRKTKGDDILAACGQLANSSTYL